MTTGVPTDIASRTETPRGSSIDGSTYTSASRPAARTSSWPSGPTWSRDSDTPVSRPVPAFRKCSGVGSCQHEPGVRMLREDRGIAATKSSGACAPGSGPGRARSAAGRGPGRACASCGRDTVDQPYGTGERHGSGDGIHVDGAPSPSGAGPRRRAQHLPDPEHVGQLSDLLLGRGRSCRASGRPAARPGPSARSAAGSVTRSPHQMHMDDVRAAHHAPGGQQQRARGDATDLEHRQQVRGPGRGGRARLRPRWAARRRSRHRGP